MHSDIKSLSITRNVEKKSRFWHCVLVNGGKCQYGAQHEPLTSSSLSKASFSFLLLSKARSQTCCHLLTSKLTLGFLVSICVCDPEG